MSSIYTRYTCTSIISIYSASTCIGSISYAVTTVQKFMKLTNNMNKYFTRLVINLCMNLSSTKVHTIFRKSSQVGGQIKRKVACKSKTCIKL